MAKRVNKAVAKIFHRINESLAGTDLWTYTCAVLMVLGLDKATSKGVRPGNLSCFYNSASIVRHHTANGNFKKVNGMLLLTPKGRAHFKIRFSEDSAQFVDSGECKSIASALRSGKASDLPTEWKACALSPVTMK